METLEILKDIIKFQESSNKVILEAYRAHPKDPWTIGFGHTKGVKKGMKITAEQAEVFLEEDIAKAYGQAEKMVLPHIWKQMNPNQRASLTDVVFNYGPGLPKEAPKAMRNLNAGNFSDFQHEMFDPKDGLVKDTIPGKGKVVMSGLVYRRGLDRSLWNLPPEMTGAYAAQK